MSTYTVGFSIVSHADQLFRPWPAIFDLICAARPGTGPDARRAFGPMRVRATMLSAGEIPLVSLKC